MEVVPRKSRTRKPKQLTDKNAKASKKRSLDNQGQGQSFAKSQTPRRKKSHQGSLKAVSKQRATSRKKKGKAKQLCKELCLSLAILLLMLGVVQQFTFTLPKMVGYSMVPSVNDGDRLFVSKLAKPKRFKLVYFKNPETDVFSVRRVIGLPEEQVYYREDQLYVNDQPVVERFIEPIVNELKETAVYTEDFTLDQLGLGTRIPIDCYLVLGDNRPFASDSRTLGFVKKADIVGVVEMRLLPFHEMKQY